MSTALYDSIGTGYQVCRRPDVRIAAVVARELAEVRTLVNVGAGVGSYEPMNRQVVAVEPSQVMIAQRPRGAAPVVRARAEALPFAARAFDCAMGILTLHHWTDVRQGLREMRRVARRRVVLLTWIGFLEHFWLLDYLPQIKAIDEPMFPSLAQLAASIGPVRAIPVPIPHDCTDGFLCAYWRRPEAYLDADVRRAISTFARMPDVAPGLARLQHDLASGDWHERYGALLSVDAKDFGYRVVVAEGMEG